MAKASIKIPMIETTIGINVQYVQEGSLAVFRIDLTGDYGETAKNRRVATSSGNQNICGGRAKIGLNLVDPVKTRTLEVKDFTDCEQTNIGENIAYSIHKGILIVAIDMAAEGRRSGKDPEKPGKTRLIATTGGFQGIQQGLRLGINVYDPIPTGPPLTVFA